ncbi:hypothetical protein QL285_015625 [Trifolium repens]|nr:hypothetical protein QL285_015625 [Trifolium repens]
MKIPTLKHHHSYVFLRRTKQKRQVPAVWRAKQKRLLLGQFATMDLDSWMIKFRVLQTYKVISLTITNKTACDTAFLNVRSPISTDGGRYVTADAMMTFSTYREPTS